MAFEKDFTLPNGIICKYTKLMEIHWNRSDGDQVLAFASWTTKEALEAGYAPANTWRIQMNNAFGPELTQGVLDACDTVLMARPEFEGATIVPDVNYVPPVIVAPEIP